MSDNDIMANFVYFTEFTWQSKKIVAFFDKTYYNEQIAELAEHLKIEKISIKIL